MSKDDIKQLLADLIDRYNSTLRTKNHEDISEETIRTWLNEFLGLFGWDVQNTKRFWNLMHFGSIFFTQANHMLRDLWRLLKIIL